MDMLTTKVETMCRESKKDISLAAEKLLSLLPEKRFHTSPDASLVLRKEEWEKRHKEELVFSKPVGLWYDFQGDWIRWCLSEGWGGIRDYIYEVKVDKSKILQISNIKEFEEFENEYLYHPELFNSSIRLHNASVNWEKVQVKYSGVEIIPYLWDKRLSCMWYYGWDCASGCIWDLEAFKMRLFAAYNEQKDCFELVEHAKQS
jgi:hypothetical protein